LPGQGIDIASIQFFRTSSAAKAAAKQDPAKASPFKAGDTPVILDTCEEENEDGETLTIDPADIYEIAEPPAEIPTEPVTEATTDPLDETDPPTPTPEDTTDVPLATVQKGCRSALCLPLAWPALILPALALSKRKKSIP
jgi:hypothetical protein